MKLSAPYTDHGTGPTTDALVLPRLNWQKLAQPVRSERAMDIDE